MRNKIVPDIELSRREDRIEVALIGENVGEDTVEVRTPTPRFFDFDVYVRPEGGTGWEPAYYTPTLEAQAVERWQIPEGEKIIERVAVPSFEKTMDRLEEKSRDTYEDLFEDDEEEDVDEILEKQARRESLNIDSNESHKFEVSTRMMDSDTYLSASSIMKPSEIEERELPESNSSDYQVLF